MDWTQEILAQTKENWWIRCIHKQKELFYNQSIFLIIESIFIIEGVGRGISKAKGEKTCILPPQSDATNIFILSPPMSIWGKSWKLDITGQYQTLYLLPGIPHCIPALWLNPQTWFTVIFIALQYSANAQPRGGRRGGGRDELENVVFLRWPEGPGGWQRRQEDWRLLSRSRKEWMLTKQDLYSSRAYFLVWRKHTIL